MAAEQSHPSNQVPKRSKVFLREGFQLRFALLVAGSLTVLLLFTGLHGLTLAKSILPGPLVAQTSSLLHDSMVRVFTVGALYITIVTIASVFLSHRTVGPIRRLEEDLRIRAKASGPIEPIRLREGDELEDLVNAINAILEKQTQKGRK